MPHECVPRTMTATMLAGAAIVASTPRSALLANRTKQLETLRRFHFLALQMPVDAFDRLCQLPLVVRFYQAAYRNLRRPGISVPGREQCRDAFLLRMLRELDTGLLLP